MKTKVLWALVALNVLLLIGFFAPRGRGIAHAQVAGQTARAGDHLLMVSGEVTGGSSAVVYIIDEDANGLSARVYDNNAKAFQDMAPIDLSRIFTPAGGAGGR